MTHPIFHKEIFVETAFEKRFQAMLRSAWHKRSWHVIVADPGAGQPILQRSGAAAARALERPQAQTYGAPAPVWDGVPDCG